MKILLSTDGSNFSKAAIDFCPNIVTDQKNTSLKIISAVELPMPIAARMRVESGGLGRGRCGVVGHGLLQTWKGGGFWENPHGEPYAQAHG